MNLHTAHMPTHRVSGRWDTSFSSRPHNRPARDEVRSTSPFPAHLQHLQMLHAQPIDWEVVESYSVDPVRVYVEDDGAAIVRLAPHQIVGDYTFDMTPPARAAQSTHSPHATRKSIDIPSKGLKSYCPRRRASHSNPVPHSRSQQSRPTLPERHSDPPASRSLDHESPIPRTSSPEQISDPNTPSTTPEGGSPKSKRLSLALSFLKPHRRSSSSSAESSSGASDAGTSDGESDPAPRLPRASKRPSAPARVPTRAPVEVPAYKKSDLKRALIFARHELMKQVTQSGKNALVVEGWTVTILRQSSLYRIHIEYIGQPAIVAYPEDATPSSVPPFLEVVDR